MRPLKWSLNDNKIAEEVENLEEKKGIRNTSKGRGELDGKIDR